MRLTKATVASRADPLEAFVAELKSQGLSTATCRGYQHDLRHFLLWLNSVSEGAGQVERIAAVDVANYREHLSRVKRSKPATIKRKVEALRRLCRWAYRNKLLKEDVAADIGPVHLAKSKAPRGLTESEVYGLLREAGESGHGLAKRNYALVQLLLQAGLRVGEIAEMYLPDLKMSSRTGVVRVRRAKGRKEREVPLNASARRALQSYLDSRPQPLLSEDPVFVSERGEALSVRSIQNLITVLARRARITRLAVSPHTLRHTFSHTYLKKYPGKLVDLAALLGHESLDTTAIYTRPSMDELAADLEGSPLNVYH